MADIMHLEDAAGRAGATTQEVTMNTSTGKKGTPEHKPAEFQVHIPKTLKDAIAIEGEREVFKRYLQSLAVAIQAQVRQDLGEKKTGERKRASYLEAVGL